VVVYYSPIHVRLDRQMEVGNKYVFFTSLTYKYKLWSLLSYHNASLTYQAPGHYHEMRFAYPAVRMTSQQLPSAHWSRFKKETSVKNNSMPKTNYDFRLRNSPKLRIKITHPNSFLFSQLLRSNKAMRSHPNSGSIW
jgi:hypothetical protein